MDAAAAGGFMLAGRERGSVRRSRVVPAPRPWRLSAPPVRERQRWQERPFTGESTKETVKPLRGESRDVLAVPVKPVCVLPLPLHTVLRAQSAPGFPCALGSQRANELQSSGENRAV